MSVIDCFPEKIIVAKFGLMHSTHIDFENLLINNNITFQTKINVEYFEADNLEVISFFVDSKDIAKAKELEMKVLSERRNYPNYPKFMKIFWFGLLGVTILWGIIAILLN